MHDQTASSLFSHTPTAPVEHRERSSLHIYLQRISETLLLTLDEEITLAQRIRRGDGAARERMIRANLRLVVKIAKDYQHFGLPLLDLVSEGNFGLIKAVERFDPRKGAKFSTYAAWWIKQSVKHALSTLGKTIRLPVYLVDNISNMRRTAMRLTEQLGREPTDEEVAVELQVPTAKVAHLKSVSVQPASLEARVGGEGRSVTLAELVRDENAASPYECLREKRSVADLHAMVDALEPREAEIIRLRFGLDGREELTLEEAGKKFGITRERIRQLEHLAVGKLRKALRRHEAIRSRDELEREALLRGRVAVLREFIESRAKSPPKRARTGAACPGQFAPALPRDGARRTAA